MLKIIPKGKMRRIVLLDRDGVINKDEATSVRTLDQFCFIPGSVEAIVDIYAKGYEIIVITNQACIGRGIRIEKR